MLVVLFVVIKTKIPKEISNKKLKPGDVCIKFGNGQTALHWKDKEDVYMFSSMHSRLSFTEALKTEDNANIIKAALTIKNNHARFDSVGH